MNTLDTAAPAQPETLTWVFSKSMTGGYRAPIITLHTREETLAYLDAPVYPPGKGGLEQYAVCSLYLCDFLDELEKEGYVYNAPALRRFEKEHDLPPSSENGSPLSVLIYNAQSFRRARKLERDGWRPGSPELMREAWETKQRIEIQGENMLGGTVHEQFIVREKDGMLRVFRPGKRTQLGIGGLPCKLVPVK